MFISRTPSNIKMLDGDIIYFFIVCSIRKPLHWLHYNDNCCFTSPLFWWSYKIINRQWGLNYIFMAGTAHYDWHYGQLAVEVISFWLWWRERGMENISSRLPAGFWWHIWPPLGSRLTSWLASIQPTERLDHLNRKYFIY